MNIWAAFGLVGLGMALAHAYNWLAWRKYYEGRKDSYNREQRNGR